MGKENGLEMKLRSLVNTIVNEEHHVGCTVNGTLTVGMEIASYFRPVAYTKEPPVFENSKCHCISATGGRGKQILISILAFSCHNF